MKYFTLLWILFFLTGGCSIHKIQNTTLNNYVCEFQISGISTSTYYNELLPRLNRLLISDNLISANDSTLQQKEGYIFKFRLLIEKEKIVILSRFISYYKIFANEVFDSGGNFNLNLYDNHKKTLIYQYSKKSKSNLFDTKRNYIFLKKYFYKIK